MPVLRGKEDRSMDIEIAAERGVLPMFSGTQDAKRYRKHFLEHRAGAIDVDCRELAHFGRAVARHATGEEFDPLTPYQRKEVDMNDERKKLIHGIALGVDLMHLRDEGVSMIEAVWFVGREESGLTMDEVKEALQDYEEVNKAA